jgi:hypothetical protein
VIVVSHADNKCVYPLDTALAQERDHAGIETLAEDGSGIVQASVIAGFYPGDRPWPTSNNVMRNAPGGSGCTAA